MKIGCLLIKVIGYNLVNYLLEIIKEYLLKLGIDLSSIDDKISNGFVLQRKEW